MPLYGPRFNIVLTPWSVKAKTTLLINQGYNLVNESGSG